MDTQPFTYANIISAAQLTALNSPTPPPPGSQQYLIYVQYINFLAIQTWENQRGVLWNELWVDQPNFATLSAGTTSVPLPDDFKFMGGGIVRLTFPNSIPSFPSVLPIPIRRLPEIELNPYQTKKEFYVTGNINTGFELVLGWQIQPGDPEDGATISFRYYKYAAVAQTNAQGILLNPNDVPEMSDPSYIFKKVTAAVAAANYNLNLYTIYENQATDSLTQMIQANEMPTNYQDDYVKDVDQLTGGGFMTQNRLNSSWWTHTAV